MQEHGIIAQITAMNMRERKQDMQLAISCGLAIDESPAFTLLLPLVEFATISSRTAHSKTTDPGC